MQTLDPLAASVGAALLRQRRTLTLAESCTGGLVAACVTSIAGSSAWFERGFVTYTNLAKQELLGVPAAILAAHGAVSEATALAMTAGALNHSPADWAVSLTGIAGPGGGSAEKPVGTVWIAWQSRGQVGLALRHQFEGDRAAIRLSATETALRGLLERLESADGIANPRSPPVPGGAGNGVV